MCACEPRRAFVCSRCRTIDDRAWTLRFEPDDREQDEQARYDTDRRRPEDEQ